MAKSTGANRLTLQLDPRVAFEALILNRLERMPKGRRQEWLQECQSLRMVQGEVDPLPIKLPQEQGVATRQPRTAFAAWLAQPSATQTQTLPMAVATNTAAGQAKPFAGLRKVIG